MLLKINAMSSKYCIGGFKNVFFFSIFNFNAAFIVGKNVMV